MRAFDFTTKSIDEELQILNDPLYQQERPKVVELIRLLQNAREPAALFELQRQLIVQGRARQQISREIRDARRAVGAELRRVAVLQPKPINQISELQHRLDLLDHQRRVSEALRFTLLSIGDGIAWRVLGYDRGALSILGMGERVARFAEGRGFEAEATELSRLWTEEAVFAIHNDLTTCLRHGDLTVPRPQARRVDLIEVKVSKQLKEGSPQMRRMADVVTLLNDGTVTAPHGHVIRLHRLPFRFRTALANLPALIRKARGDGYAPSKVSPCQFVAAIDYRTSAGCEEELSAKHAANRAKLGWFDGGHRTFEWFSSGRRMRDRSYSFSMMAPLTIFPLPAEDVADISLGFIELYSVLNGNLLEQAFARDGIAATVVTPPESNDVFLRAEVQVSRGILVVQVGPQLREQMLLELMTPANVVGAVKRLAANLDASPGADGQSHIVALDDEARVWERLP